MYSYLKLVVLIIVPLTTSLSHNSSFPNNIANWSIDCDDNSYVGPSIIFSGALRFQYGPSSKEFVDMPTSHNLVNASASCEDDVQFVELHWISENSLSNQWLGLKFTKQGTRNSTYGLSAVRYLNFENMNTLFKEIKLDSAFGAKLNHSFRCEPYRNITSSENVTMFLLTKNLQLQAFRGNGSGINFDTAEECQASSPPYEEQGLDTGVLIGMSVAVAISGVLGAGIGFYLCKKFRQGSQ